MGENEFFQQRPTFYLTPAMAQPPQALGGFAAEPGAPVTERSGDAVLADARSRITIGSAMIFFTTLYAIAVV